MENVGAVTFNESLPVPVAGLRRAPRAARDRRAARALAHVVRQLGHHAVVERPVAERVVRDVGVDPRDRAASPSSPASGRRSRATRRRTPPSRTSCRRRIRSSPTIDDLADVEVNFDAITYDKGASVLKQLVAWVGLDAFQRGVGAYLTRARRRQRHAPRPARRARARERARPHALVARSGSRPRASTPCAPSSRRMPRARSPPHASSSRRPREHPTLRPHRLAIGCYDARRRRARAHAPRRARHRRRRRPTCPSSSGLPRPDLLLVNDDDLTYAKVRLDDGSFADGDRAPRRPRRSRRSRRRARVGVGRRARRRARPRSTSCGSCSAASAHETQSAARGARARAARARVSAATSPTSTASRSPPRPATPCGRSPSSPSRAPTRSCSS